MTRSDSKQAMLEELGAVPVVADALDPDQVAEAVGLATPDVVVHQLTAIPPTSTYDASIADSRSPTGFAPRAPTTCCPQARRWVSSASSLRAMPVCRTPAPARPSSGRTIRSTPIPRRGVRRWRPSVTSRRRSGARWTEGLVSAALRLALRTRHLGRPQPTREPDRADLQAPVPHRRRATHRRVQTHDPPGGVGTGLRLFAEAGTVMDLQLTDTRTTATGVILATYQYSDVLQ